MFSFLPIKQETEGIPTHKHPFDLQTSLLSPNLYNTLAQEKLCVFKQLGNFGQDIGSSPYYLFRVYFSRKYFLLLLYNLVAPAHGITAVEIQNTRCSACRGLIITCQVSLGERLSYLKNLRSVGKLRLSQQELVLFVVYYYASELEEIMGDFSDQSYSLK